MAGLRPVTRLAFVSRLRALGFTGPYRREGRRAGKHPEYMERVRDGERDAVGLPNEHNTDIGVDLLRRLLNQAGISRKEWLGE